VLVFSRMSDKSGYPADLEICLPGGASPPGAAGLAFGLDRRAVVYVPYRKVRTAWIHEWRPQTLGFSMDRTSQEAWTEKDGQEWFESSLSVPVYFDAQPTEATRRKAGVLTFSTRAPDPFEPPDFLIAERFGYLISQALFLTETVVDQSRNGNTCA
jgi:hypothetical protein